MTQEIRSRIVDAQYSYNFHQPERYAATAILKQAFQSEQEKILKERQQFFPHALLVQNKVVIPRKITISGVRSIQYDSVLDSMLVTQFEESVKDVITRLQLPIDSVIKAKIDYIEAKEAKEAKVLKVPRLVLTLKENEENTTITILELNRKEHPRNKPEDVQQMPESDIHIGASNRYVSALIILHRNSGLMYPPTIKPDLKTVPSDEKGKRLRENLDENGEIVKQYLGSLWKPSWNYLGVKSLTYRTSDQGDSPTLISPSDDITEGELIEKFNQFVR